MEWVRKNRNSGFTLIEVMISMLVIMIIVIGAVSYMYACVWNARRADVQITANRLGQIMLEGWKVSGAGDEILFFDPTDNDFDDYLPEEITAAAGPPGLSTGTPLGSYRVKVNNVNLFVTLSYRNEQPVPLEDPLYLLNACVAWNRNYVSDTLSGTYDSISMTSYSIYNRNVDDE